ncbi:MAG: hypothetical protein FJ319_05925 [SAR202 cluster bacterium]|nr:hypothetical protein [SAR202 cluster bacterium]
MRRIAGSRLHGLATAASLYILGTAALGDVITYLVMAVTVIVILVAITIVQRLVPRPGDRRNWKERLRGRF